MTSQNPSLAGLASDAGAIPTERSAVGIVTQKLRSMINAGLVLPTERLIETDLARELGSNRANVRTALARLEQEGLVVIEPNRGARVRLYTEEEAIEITEARGALEGLAARYAAERATKSDKAKLVEQVERMSDAAGSLDLLGYSEINGAFHAELHAVARHATTTRLLQTLRSQAIRFQYRGVMVPGRLARSMAEHDAILAAVVSGDADAAERSMRDHILNVTRALREAMLRARPKGA